MHRLPDHLSYEDGALVNPLAVAVHVVRQAPQLPDHAVVLGLGTVGLQVAAVLLAEGVARVTGIERSPLRRSVASDLGVIAASGIDEVPPDPEVDLVVEATGASELVEAAARLVRPRGSVLVVALYEEASALNPTVLVQKEIQVRGSARVTPDDYRDAIDLIAAGQVRAASLVTHRMPLTALAEAFDAQLDATTSVKVMIVADPG